MMPEIILKSVGSKERNLHSVTLNNPADTRICLSAHTCGEARSQAWGAAKHGSGTVHTVSHCSRKYFGFLWVHLHPQCERSFATGTYQVFIFVPSTSELPIACFLSWLLIGVRLSIIMFLLLQFNGMD
jgi:hypothetical protein